MHVRCELLDEPISTRVVEVMKPKHIEVAIRALEEVERREKALEHQWRMRIERAEYEAGLAQRRYEAVDPANRLVAGTLERQWNDALVKLEEIKEEFGQNQRKNRITATEQQKAELMKVANDLPRLWKAPSTKAKDRKRIVRLLIKDITVERLAEPKKMMLHLRWQGGRCEDIPITMPPSYSDQLRYPDEIVEKVRGLAKELTDSQIADALNQQGINSAKGRSFTTSMIKWIKHKHRIPAPNLKRPEELTVEKLAEKLAVSRYIVYYWIKRNIVLARRVTAGSPYWITMDPQKEEELAQWVQHSTKIRRQRAKHC
jgi:hypothetical protein